MSCSKTSLIITNSNSPSLEDAVPNIPAVTELREQLDGVLNKSNSLVNLYWELSRRSCDANLLPSDRAELISQMEKIKTAIEQGRFNQKINILKNKIAEKTANIENAPRFI